MKKLLLLAVVAQAVLLMPVKSEAQHRHHDRGPRFSINIDLGGVLNGLLGTNFQSRPGYEDCFDSNRCGSQYSHPHGEGQGVHVYIEQGQRLWVDGYPQARCRSFRQVVVHPQYGQQRSPPQVACLDRQGQWSPAPQQFNGRFRSYQDTRFQPWGSVVDRPMVLQPRPQPHWQQQQGGQFGQRPPFGGPPSGPIYGGGQQQQGPPIAGRPVYVQPAPGGFQRPIGQQGPPAVAGPAQRPIQQQDCRVTNTCPRPIQQGPPPAVLPFGVR